MPGQDLYVELARLAKEEDLEAAVIVSGVGSFMQASIRYADQPHADILHGPLEIVSLTGTVSKHGMHVHVSVSDGAGTTVGGHLTEGSKIYTTVELVLLDLSHSFSFERALCPISKYEELVVKSKGH
jgi:predicted DNA-binding protein with PD1-like motif